MTKVHYVYMLRCSDDSLYTGYTADIERRVAEHNNGEGAKYTRGRNPVVLRRVERHDSRSEAQSREYNIKQFSRSEKEAITPAEDDRIALGGDWVD